MASPYLTQIYAGLNADTKPDPFAAAKAAGGAASSLNDTFMNQLYAAAVAARGKPSSAVAAPSVIKEPPMPPPVVATTAPVPHLPQQALPPQGPTPQSQDVTVGVSAAPLQYRAVAAPGRKAGELNTMGPNQEALLTKAAGAEGNAAAAAGANIASAMTAQQAPLDTRAQYLSALAEREAQDQTGRNEQNRQRQEDYEKEAKDLSQMAVDPNRRMKSGEGILDALGVVFGGIGQGFLRRAGDMNAQNVGVQLAAANKAQDIDAQHANIAQKKGYVDQLYANMRAQREMQGDQVASNQRQAGLMKEATGAQFDQAGIGVAMSEAIAKGDMGQAQALANLYRQQAAAQHYVPAAGGGRQYQVKLANGAVVNMTEKEFNKYAVENEGKTIETGQKIAINSAEQQAKAVADHKAKDDTEKRTVPTGNGGSYLAGSPEEAKDHREARAAAATYTETLQKMQKLRGELGAHELALAKTGIKTDKVKELEALQGVATGQFNKMNKFGALDNGTVDLINRTMGNSTDWANPTARYKTLIDGVNADLEAKARAGQGYVRPQIQQAAPSFKPVGK